MYTPQTVKFKVTNIFGSHEIGDIIDVYLLFKFETKEALLYHRKNSKGSDCIFVASHESNGDYYVERKYSIYRNGPFDRDSVIRSIIDMFKFPELPTVREQRAINLLKKKGYKVTK